MTSRNNAIFASRFPARNISPVDAAMIKEVLEQIHAAFESLPEHLRILLELAHPHLFRGKLTLSSSATETIRAATAVAALRQVLKRKVPSLHWTNILEIVLA